MHNIPEYDRSYAPPVCKVPCVLSKVHLGTLSVLAHQHMGMKFLRQELLDPDSSSSLFSPPLTPWLEGKRGGKGCGQGHRRICVSYRGFRGSLEAYQNLDAIMNSPRLLRHAWRRVTPHFPISLKANGQWPSCPYCSPFSSSHTSCHYHYPTQARQISSPLPRQCTVHSPTPYFLQPTIVIQEHLTDTHPATAQTPFAVRISCRRLVPCALWKRFNLIL